MNRSIPLLFLALAGCPNSEGEKKTAPSVTATATQAPSVTAAPVVDASLPAAELKITTGGTTMVYDVMKFEVKAGQPVHVVLANKPPGALPHNFVLLTAGKEASYAASVVSLEKANYYKD